jgi:hypothetical protein
MDDIYDLATREKEKYFCILEKIRPFLSLREMAPDRLVQFMNQNHLIGEKLDVRKLSNEQAQEFHKIIKNLNNDLKEKFPNDEFIAVYEVLNK